MDPHRSTPKSEWASSINVVCGAWLMLAPLVLGYGIVHHAFWNDLFIGFLVICAGWMAGTGHFRIGSWANLAFGLWLVISPFVLGFSGHTAPVAAGNNIALGLVIAGLALFALAYYPEQETEYRRRAAGI